MLPYEIYYDLEKISKNQTISKNDIMLLLHKYGKTISIHDLMIATCNMRESGKFVQKQYREKFHQVYVKYFIMRIKEINEDNRKDNKKINKTTLIEAIKLLKYQYEHETITDKFQLIYTMVSIYTTFILEEPIHPVGTPFPGNLKVEEKNNIFYCPVKKAQENNANAVCKLCLAEQTPE